ncbi:hypothetical protein [Agaribacter marinus]|uniref:Lipoprotein n=1 Tax=Agaribacter marinus TaxID=1431249 RepID=A0AA37SSZ7_9ALTE|nr:hypothetical protein [Agaribacter marinus]GLR69441.1 hypothetical protein GCM10007852_03490 [Agaribacter marinus]
MKKSITITLVTALSILSAGCASIQGTVYKQADGNFKATYASSSEKDVRKVIHSDAQLTCKQKTSSKEIIVLEESVENLEDDSPKEGFAAVAGSAVSLTGKYFGAESVRGSLIFSCD